MAHYAQIVDKYVVQVVKTDEDYFNEKGQSRFPGKWIQTSYNTRGGVHYDPLTGEPSSDQSKALRKNFAGVGFTYDEENDAFIPPKPYPSWNLTEGFLWESPVPYPNNENSYIWNETTLNWEQRS